MRLKRIFGFFGLAAIFSLIYFLVLPTTAQASGPENQDTAEVEFLVAENPDGNQDLLDNETEGAVVVEEEDVYPGETPSVEAEANVQLVMNNPFGRTNTMGGRR